MTQQKPKLKIASATALLLFIATPAMSSESKTVNGVTFTCVVTGSDSDGFQVNTSYDGDKAWNCKASCRLTKGDKTTVEYNLPFSGNAVVHHGKGYLDGKGGLPGKPFSNPELTKASCEPWKT
jgi:hypothetical protein